MKVLAVTAVVVVLLVACGVQTQPIENLKPFWVAFLRNVTADVCSDNEELCKANGRRCFAALKRVNVETEEEVSPVRTNLTECASQVGANEADFSSLNVESMKEATKEEAKGGFNLVGFLSQYGVAEQHAGPILECVMNKNGELAMLRTCLVTSEGEST